MHVCLLRHDSHAVVSCTAMWWELHVGIYIEVCVIGRRSSKACMWHKARVCYFKSFSACRRECISNRLTTMFILIWKFSIKIYWQTGIHIFGMGNSRDLVNGDIYNDMKCTVFYMVRIDWHPLLRCGMHVGFFSIECLGTKCALAEEFMVGSFVSIHREMSP